MVWSRMTPGGRALAVLLPLLSVGGAALTALLVVAGPFIGATIGANLPIVRFLAASVITFLITVPVAFLLIYMEMKIIALMNLRIGPDRIGPAGAVMSVVHGLKVLMKEDFTPPSVDVPVFTLAPVVVYLASFMTIMVIPFAPDLTSVGLEFGLLYFFAIGGLGVVGLMMAGWSSFNKYSLLGGIRAAAQAISYEIPLTLSVVGIIILTGTLSLPKIVGRRAARCSTGSSSASHLRRSSSLSQSLPKRTEHRSTTLRRTRRSWPDLPRNTPACASASSSSRSTSTSLSSRHSSPQSSLVAPTRHSVSPSALRSRWI
jgi:hypothetical protein